MTATLANLIIIAFLPVAISAAVWAVAIYALGQRDQISLLVSNLGTDPDDDNLTD